MEAWIRPWTIERFYNPHHDAVEIRIRHDYDAGGHKVLMCRERVDAIQLQHDPNALVLAIENAMNKIEDFKTDPRKQQDYDDLDEVWI